MKNILFIAAAFALFALAPLQAKALIAAIPTTQQLQLARTWTMLPQKSSIHFEGLQMDTPFSGTIGSFTSTIHFDPDHLAQSKVTVEVDTNSIATGEKERDDNIKSKDWFDVKTFPTARFETTGFTKTGDNAFTAEATLTIRGISVPVKLPFTLNFSKPEKTRAAAGKEQVVMTGKMTIDRSKFTLGQGDWADPTVIANDVALDITVTAVSDSAKQTRPLAPPSGTVTKEKPPSP